MTRYFATALCLFAAACSSSSTPVTVDADGGGVKDAASDGSCGPQPPTECAELANSTCGGGPPSCIDGTWTCPPCEPLDSGTPGPCGTCGPNQYCYVSGGGVVLDGASNISNTCTNLPSSCIASPTCGCLSDAGVGCGCTGSGSSLLESCLVP